MARVNIAGAIQVCGHREFWTRVFNKFDMAVDENLLDMLISKDRKKLRKRNREQTKEGKAVRSRLKYEMLASTHRSQMIDMKKGERYESGISITEARKCLRNRSKRNNGNKETW